MPGELSDYEKLRLKNIEENRKVLAGLGIANAFQTHFKVIKKAPKRKRLASTPTQRKAVKVDNGSTENQGSSYKTGSRRSSRLRGQDAPSLEDMELETSQTEDEEYRRPKLTKHRPNFYGLVEGVEIGTLWQTRLECCYAGVHRPTVAGIHGGEDGCYSIALSGGYEDDIDLGDSFTYTGEGGRDLKGTKSNPKNLRTAKQSKDQTLTRGNLALSQNVETRNPVRVIRGYKLQSPFATEEGYRYDGLYRVEKYWFTTGMSGFGVYKFVLRRLEDQAPPPWEIENLDHKAKAFDEDCRSDSAYGSNHGDKSDTESIESKDTTDKDGASRVSSPCISEHEDKKDEEEDVPNTCSREDEEVALVTEGETTQDDESG